MAKKPFEEQGRKHARRPNRKAPSRMPESFAEEDARKGVGMGDFSDFEVPSLTVLDKMTKAPVKLPDLIPIGWLVYFKQDLILPASQTMAGWVLQNSNCPGGQTKSYVVTSNWALIDVEGAVAIKPVRIRADQILQAFNPIDLDIYP